MRSQWTVVMVVLAALATGAWALVKFGPERSPVEIGADAPDIRVLDLATGDSVSIRAKYKGQVTLVNIWATWCGPCKEEMPAMQKVYDQLKGRGFRIAAVSVDQGSPDKVRAWVRTEGFTFDILQDGSGLIQQLYQTTGVPESALLDRDGRIVKRVIGAHDWSSEINRQLIERYLPAPQVSAR
ncbi:MAG: TlpA disulfide reductase family protein [Gemmatimonadales bacterium]|nr:TlpA disulfide reductase family protein [Gemmatimonadales bacterium]